MSDHDVAIQVWRDVIDILVDLSGHTARHRLPVLAKHPAPVQATWLGYLNTTGLPEIGYRICDSHTDPAGSEGLGTEALVRMPHSQWCYVPWYCAPLVAAPHESRPNALVFGSFNQDRKISDECLRLWCRVLTRVPEAELLVLDFPQPAMRKAFLERIERLGGDPRRVTVRGRESIARYFETLGNVDIALDTFPYNGATTTLDTLWMGIPIVALRGSRGISRSGYSILRTLGLDELIAETPDEYVEINVRLALDRSWRARLRASLRTMMEKSPLMDAGGFTEALERRYRAMWLDWCERQAAKAAPFG
jgi:predicted O-linked N-acetylglucosamine transferase (SPINDLY family)